MTAVNKHSRQWRSGRLPPRQRGIALLVAILLVALGTIIAASIAYENAMTARRGAAVLALDQSVLVGEAAEALAAYGLRAVWRSDKSHIYIGQGWDKPVGPVEVVPDVMLTAALEDLSGRFNLNSLVNSDGTVNQTNFAAFQQLLIGVCQPDLAYRGGGLALLQPQRSLRQLQLPAPERDRARGHEDDLLIALTQAQEVLNQGLEPGPVDPAGLGVDEQGGADFHDNAPRLLQG